MYAYKISHSKKKNFFNSLSINSLFIIINIICFIVFSIIIYLNQNALDYIALKPFNILNGRDLWTFFTSMFMHASFFHLFANMFSLFFIGSLIERILGKKRYLYFYLIAGLFSGLLFVLSSFIFSSNLNSYAVGASGALFGLIGLLVLITPDLPVYMMLIPIPIKMKYAGPGMLLLLWFISIAGNIPIGNTAHFGGLISGLAYGIYLRKRYKNKIRFIQKHFH